MSKALLPSAGLRWWSEEELTYREVALQAIHRTLSSSLYNLNSAWRFRRVEAPMLLPQSLLSSAYTGDDVFFLQRRMMDEEMVMRPETTSGSYLAAEQMLNHGGPKILPLCVWQVGKSYRVEKSDGASASRLRFNEFTQAEWQCIYREDTKADYRKAVLEPLSKTISWLTGRPDRVVASDRLPAYSRETLDVEILRPARQNTTQATWTEMCSVSLRTDFKTETTPNPLLVLEVAVGLDRIVEVAGEIGILSNLD